MSTPSFHLSLPVRSVDDSVAFLELLGGTVSHRDPSGYVNVDLCGARVTLAEGDVLETTAFHFGVNVTTTDFDAIANRVRDRLVSEPSVVDAGTPIERRKMYVRCPSGYLVEIKAYR